jgi:manganese transport protein
VAGRALAVIPLVRFASDRIKMGELVNARWLTRLAWVVAAILASLNARLLVQTASAWVQP